VISIVARYSIFNRLSSGELPSFSDLSELSLKALYEICGLNKPNSHSAISSAGAAYTCFNVYHERLDIFVV
jgi:hypothetical protein